ncbi:MAG: 3-dehydroquinate synthase [Rhodobacteraceae bacterium]|nr:3-dehydroquinate synthase [Paracoccaceae bacterium]
MIRTVTVTLPDHRYDILIGTGLLARIGPLAGSLIRGRRTAIVTDEAVAEHHLPCVLGGFAEEGIRCDHLIMPAGEGTKDWSSLQQVVEWLLSLHLDRLGTVIALGGGVIGDLTGFAASITRRGLACIQVPTTLLAQVDSAVGGKTGINSSQGKNLIGTFHQPSAVICDYASLASLSWRNLRAGYGEVIKYGLLGDADFFDMLDSRQESLRALDDDYLATIIERSCHMKADIVAADTFEHGERATLNLGHTFGHALESATGYAGRLLHGEAVALGCVLAFETSVRMGLCPQKDLLRVRDHIASFGLPTRISQIQGRLPDIGSVLAAMAQDKKIRNGKPQFILVRAIGAAFATSDVDMQLVEEIITASAAS